MPLTKQQELFCQHYVDTLNGAKAARLAGYSSESGADAVSACKLLRIAKVLERIKEISSEMIGDEEQFKTEIILHLKKILKASPLEVVEIGSDDKGRPVISMKDEIDDSAIQEIGNMYHGVKVKMYSKLDAIEKLMKYYEMFKELGTKEHPHYHLHKKIDEIAAETLTELDALT